MPGALYAPQFHDGTVTHIGKNDTPHPFSGTGIRIRHIGKLQRHGDDSTGVVHIMRKTLYIEDTVGPAELLVRELEHTVTHPFGREYLNTRFKPRTEDRKRLLPLHEPIIVQECIISETVQHHSLGARFPKPFTLHELPYRHAAEFMRSRLLRPDTPADPHKTCCVQIQKSSHRPVTFMDRPTSAGGER